MNNAWRGTFGDEYTKRNQYDWTKRIPVFKHILKDIKVKDILEVGSNCGRNLLTLEEMGYSAMGIEPNAYARAEAAKHELLTFQGTATEIPFGTDSFDLVFTAGVLIHIPPKELVDSMVEIIRVSRKYILAIEYEANSETMINYRGHRDMLWKRPFGKLYKDLGLKLLHHGKTEHFDRSHFWLLSK